ncbi:hypothetical protein ACFQ9U_02480 [Streptomyces sp. NPDC056568]|uniref:hypothetical protein n=1 Tax=Streptomyces sp. NPDC056568 TaxID=3345866 RepID=UPI0036C6C946
MRTLRCLAAGGDPIHTALELVAADVDQATREVDQLPASFWLPRIVATTTLHLTGPSALAPGDPTATADTGCIQAGLGNAALYEVAAVVDVPQAAVGALDATSESQLRRSSDQTPSTG